MIGGLLTTASLENTGCVCRCRTIMSHLTKPYDLFGSVRSAAKGVGIVDTPDNL